MPRGIREQPSVLILPKIRVQIPNGLSLVAGKSHIGPHVRRSPWRLEWNVHLLDTSGQRRDRSSLSWQITW